MYCNDALIVSPLKCPNLACQFAFLISSVIAAQSHDTVICALYGLSGVSSPTNFAVFHDSRNISIRPVRCLFLTVSVIILNPFIQACDVHTSLRNELWRSATSFSPWTADASLTVPCPSDFIKSLFSTFTMPSSFADVIKLCLSLAIWFVYPKPINHLIFRTWSPCNGKSVYVATVAVSSLFRISSLIFLQAFVTWSVPPHSCHTHLSFLSSLSSCDDLHFDKQSLSKWPFHLKLWHFSVVFRSYEMKAYSSFAFIPSNLVSLRLA